MIVAVPGHDAEDDFAARDLEDAIKRIAPTADESHATVQPPYRVTLLRTDSAEAKAILARANLAFDPAMESEGYVLILEAHEATIVGATGAGVFYGVQTFKQLLPLPGAARVLPTGTVRDWPAMQYRGIDDDLSRGPFPTLEFQKHQIRVFAAFKINIYSPYFEHTLLYPDHPLAAPPGSCAHARRGRGTGGLRAPVSRHHRSRAGSVRPSASRAQIRALPGRGRNSARPCARARAGRQRCPLIKDWFTQIAQEFPSPFIHIGADETFDLGRGRTQRSRRSRRAMGRCTSTSSSRFTTSLRRSIAACSSGAISATPIPTPSRRCPKT